MKHSIFTIIFSVFTVFAFGQQDAFAWRIGAYGGYNIYRGDLNSDINAFDVQHPLNDFPNTDWQGLLAYGVSAERSFKGFGIKLLATKGIFEANDRAKNYWNNDFLDNPNFERSLNVQTQLYDASLLATFYTDNGQLLSKTAIVSPYFSVGFGMTQFETFGDLYTNDNQRYYYWSDGKIYNAREGTLPNMTELQQDAEFETNLTDLKTEGVDYNTLVWNIPAAVGLKFRLCERLNLNLEVLGRYVNSDYLDDVSGNYPTSYDNSMQEYASNPNEQNKVERGDNDANDFYGMVSMSLHYNFGRKNEAFLPPVFYSAGDGNSTTTIETTTNTTINNPVVNTNIDSSQTVIEPQINAEILTTSGIEIGQTKIDSTIVQTEVIQLEKVELKTDSLQQIAVKVEETMTEAIDKIDESTTKVIVKETPTAFEIKKDTTIQIVEIPTTKVEVTNAIPQNSVDTLQFNKLRPKTINFEEETFLEVQKTRLEVATLNQQANELLKNYDAAKQDSLVLLNKKIETLDAKLEGFQEYLNQLAIQGNTNYIKPEVQAIQRSNQALVSENEALKQKYKVLVLGEENPDAVKAELAKIEAENVKNQQKVAALEQQITTLEAQKTALQNVNVTVQTPQTTTVQPTTQTATKVVNIPVVVPPKKVTKTVITPVKPMILDTTIMNTLPDSTAKKLLAYDADMKNLSAELERLNNIVIPEKDKTIDSLKMKMQYLQGQLDGVKSSNAELATLFEKRIGALQFKIANIEKQTASPQIIEKPVVVEEVIEVPTKSPALTVVENFKKSNVYFDNGSITIKSEFYNRLDRVGLLMNQYPELVVMLKGYTDKSGNPTTNFKLSKQRAEAVKNYLVRQGIRGDRIDISYYGDNAASVANDPFSRRVEVNLVIGQ